MNNQFQIAPYKVLNDTFDTISIHGSIQLFQDQFTVSYNLTKSVTSNAAMTPMSTGTSNLNGTATILRADLSELSEAAVATQLAKQIGVTLVVAKTVSTK